MNLTRVFQPNSNNSSFNVLPPPPSLSPGYALSNPLPSVSYYKLTGPRVKNGRRQQRKSAGGCQRPVCRCRIAGSPLSLGTGSWSHPGLNEYAAGVPTPGGLQFAVVPQLFNYGWGSGSVGGWTTCGPFWLSGKGSE